MVIAAVIYIVISVLLMIGAAVFFHKALQTLSRHSSPPQRFSSVVSDSRSPEFSNREEIIEMLERQFHSSPSADP